MDLKPELGYFFKKLPRVLWQAVLKFREDQCALRASALTMYTLFAIVPVLAMAFGIAKGFGLQQVLEREVMILFGGREDIVSRALDFSNNLLERTQGEVMAVLGVILLFYSLIKLMSHIENTFNRIWWVTGGRSLIRKITDYLTISMAAGLLVVVSGSANIFVMARLEKLAVYLGLSMNVEGLISLGFNFFSHLSVWLLFILFYIIMPHKRVDVRSAAAGGIIAGTLFQFIQMAYLKFQLGVSSYNAIYGSFAALPLFLVWLQASWLVLLYGAEIAFEWESTDLSHPRNLSYDNLSPRSRKIYMLSIVRLCVERFSEKASPATDRQISSALDLPLTIVRRMLDVLLDAKVLFAVKQPGSVLGYTPAMDIECMTIMDILTALDTRGNENQCPDGSLTIQALEDSLEAFDRAARESVGERKIKDI